VLALGTTDTANVAVGSNVSRAERIRRMMSVIGTDPVLWVNVRTLVTSGAWSEDKMQLWNQALVEAAPAYPNLRIFDWSSVAETDWFGADRIHYTSRGYANRARIIADALAAAFPA
jgi:lysophospholipase L1-like esterase